MPLLQYWIDMSYDHRTTDVVIRLAMYSHPEDYIHGITYSNFVTEDGETILLEQW